MADQASLIRPILHQIVTASPQQSRLVPSPLVHTASLLSHDIPESRCPNGTTSTPLIAGRPSTITKTRRQSPSLRLTVSPTPVCSSSRRVWPAEIPPTPKTPISPRFPALPDIPPTPGTPLSPISAALSELEEPGSPWPQIELQQAAMEEAVSMTLHLLIEPQHIYTEEKEARSWGSFGGVWCSWLIDEIAGELVKVADKRIYLRRQGGRSNRRLLRHLLREVVSWYKLDHPNITPFVGYVFDGCSARLLSKWQEGGNVREYMERHPVDALPLGYQVASGLAYLHSRNPQIVHGDIKPENILIGTGGVARLVDFGLSILLDDALSRDLRSSTGCQTTLQYADPVLFNDVPRTIYTDLWALGWVIYELGTSREPYDHRTTRIGIFQSVVTYDLPTPNTHVMPFPSLLWPVLEACWSKDLSCRWSAEKVASHLMGALTLDT